MIAAILLGIGIFMFLVVIHERGHFRAARVSKVKVEEFGVGIPPKAFSLGTDKKGTLFTVNWIPLGWFVRLKGEDPDNHDDFLALDSFITATLPRKLLVLFGWVIVNLLFAWFAFSIAFRKGITPISILPDSMTPTQSQSYLMPSESRLIEQGLLEKQETVIPVVIEEIMPESRADEAWLATGDTIISIGGVAIDSASIGTLLQGSIWTTTTLVYERDGQPNETTIVCGETECFLGVIIPSVYDTVLPTIRFGWWQAIQAWAHEIKVETQMTMHALGRVGKGLLSFNKEKISESTKSLSGPVGIVKMIETIFGAWGRRNLLAFAGMISLALAIFNVLPIPALDGWRALSVLIQAIGWRKPTSYYKIESYFNMTFFILLMLLGVWIIMKDLVVFRWVQIPFISW